MQTIIKLMIFLSCIYDTYSLQGQELWLGSPRQDYSEIFSSIKAKKSIKIMHIGDSHINGGYTSRPIEQALAKKYGEQLRFIYYGINGSTYSSWINESNLTRIVEEAPDLLLVSLGTNDSYTNRFSAETLRASIELFIRSVEKMLPTVKIILTTPPGCYLRQPRNKVIGYKKVKRRRVPMYSSSVSYTHNPNTRIAVNTIKYFGRAYGLAVIDLHSNIGTKQQCETWLSKGWMHSDHIHFTEKGYTQHGEIIALGLIEGIEGK